MSRSDLVLAYSRENDGTHRKDSVLVVAGGQRVSTPRRNLASTSVSTIPPLDSASWRRLPKFQRRFYEFLVYSHNLPIGEGNEYDNISHQRAYEDASPNAYSGYHGDDSGINAYDEEEEEVEDATRKPLHSGDEKVVYAPSGRDIYSPYGGMDVRLAQFVSQHNVNMNDGAIVYTVSDGEKSGTRKPSRHQFVWSICVLVLLVALLAIGIALGVIYGGPSPLTFPEAEPWWTHGLVYQIHVPTFANDISGSLGRLKDVTPRMVYLASRLQATAAILTGLLEADKNGVRNWKAINQDTNPEGDPVDVLLADLEASARTNGIELMLGMPLYSTSDRHQWFTQSVEMNPPKFANFYLWRKEAPINAIEARYYTFSQVRHEYYRHVHGNPGAPLLNLTDVEVQTEMQSVLAFWKEKLGISGVVITNSTNLLREMAAPLTKILSSAVTGECTNMGDFWKKEPINWPQFSRLIVEQTSTFTWLADNTAVDSMFGNKDLCYCEIISNERITTRTEDVSAQLYSILADLKQKTCSPVWRLVQLSADFTDYFTLQKTTNFLPGLTMMAAGEEVELMTGSTELIQWNATDPENFQTYWPINVLPEQTAQGRLEEWANFRWKTVGLPGNIFNTGWNDSEVAVTSVPRTENLFVVRRTYSPNPLHVSTFFVSFQALNAYTNLGDVVADPQGDASVQLIYEGRNLFTDNKLALDWVYLTNNDVFITLS
uniref:Aamy domain-containing protein n=1 Tax=Mesocestoides corti TaxID=53468 RepID=A0A5K3FSE6_MESCO